MHNSQPTNQILGVGSKGFRIIDLSGEVTKKIWSILHSKVKLTSSVNTKAKDTFRETTELGVAQFMWKKHSETRCLKYSTCLEKNIKI